MYGLVTGGGPDGAGAALGAAGLRGGSRVSSSGAWACGAVAVALEQDIVNKPRLFKTRLTQDFWLRDNFVKVIDANLTLPVLDDNDHPINGIEFLPSPILGHPGYLVAVARNDDELWVFDLTNRIPPFVQKLSFYVSTDDSGLCPAYDKLVQQAKLATDKDQRVKLYQQAQLILKQQVPITPIANSTVFQPLRKEVTDFRISPFGLTPFYGVGINK